MTLIYTAHDKPYIRTYRIDNKLLDQLNEIVKSSSEHNCHVKDIIIGEECSMVIIEFQGQVWSSILNGLDKISNSEYTSFKEKLWLKKNPVLVALISY